MSVPGAPAESRDSNDPTGLMKSNASDALPLVRVGGSTLGWVGLALSALPPPAPRPALAASATSSHGNGPSGRPPRRPAPIFGDSPAPGPARKEAP